MPTYAEELKNAIRFGNVNRVRKILQARDAQGNPVVNVNQLGGNRDNAVLYTLERMTAHGSDFPALTSQTYFDIFELILAHRDRHGNPIIDLNTTVNFESTTIESILIRYYDEMLTQEHARRLINTMINCRDTDGNRILNLSLCKLHSPLGWAVACNDPELVAIFLDLREANGQYSIDVNHRSQGSTTALELARTGVFRGNSLPDRSNFVCNPRIIAMLGQAGEAQIRGERLVAIPHVVNPVGTPAQPQAIGTSAAVFAANPQNTHAPEVGRTVDLSILQLKTTYASTQKPKFSDVRCDIEKLIKAQEGGRLYTAQQIADIRRGFSYVCTIGESRHDQSNLTLPEVMTLVWLGIHDKSKMPTDFPISNDKDLFVNTRKTALLDKFLAIATTYPDGGTSCVGGTRNLIVSTLDKAHPDVSIAPISEGVKELGMEQAKRFMLDKLKELPIRRQRAILRTWNEQDVDGEDGKTPATKFREYVKPLLDADLNQKLGTILPVDFFTTLNAQYEYFPEPVVHRELADLCKKIRELPDDLFNDIAALKSTITNECIFSDKEENFDGDYQKLKSNSYLALKLFENKSTLDRLVADVQKYEKDKSKGVFSKNDLKKMGAMELLNFLRTLQTLDSVKIREALGHIEKILISDEKNYFGLKFNTWFFVKEHQSELKGYYKRANTLISQFIENNGDLPFVLKKSVDCKT